MWDLSTALELVTGGSSGSGGGGGRRSSVELRGGPTAEELLRILDSCDISSNSRRTTPTVSPSPSLASGNFPAAVTSSAHHNVHVTPLAARKRALTSPTTLAAASAPDDDSRNVIQSTANQRAATDEQQSRDVSPLAADNVAATHEVKL